MNNHTCRVSGCSRVTKRYSDLCAVHQKAKARNGHELQRPVTKGEMTKWKRHVRGLIDGRENAETVWGKLHAAAEVLKSEAYARSKRTGVAGFRWERQGEADLYVAITEAGAEEVILTGLALAYLSASDPKRFLNDATLITSAGRRLRLLVPDHFKVTVNAKTGQRGRTIRDCSAKQLRHMGTRLLTVFAGPGLALREAEVLLERRSEETRTAATRAILGETPYV